MNYIKNGRLTSFSQNLRKNMTKEERHLWYDFLKLLPVTIHRQKVINDYIVDFYCAEAKLVIELDGSQHYEEEGKRKDKQRDAFFAELGYTVLRYSNLEITRNFEGVCQDIGRHITPHPSATPTPSPQGEGKTPHPSAAPTPSPQGEG